MNDASEGLPPDQATRRIREAANEEVGIGYPYEQADALIRMGLTIGDLVHVLKRSGVVYERGRPASKLGMFTYFVDGSTPNSGGRVVRLEVVLAQSPMWIKIERVMWRDSATIIPLSGGGPES